MIFISAPTRGLAAIGVILIAISTATSAVAAATNSPPQAVFATDTNAGANAGPSSPAPPQW